MIKFILKYVVLLSIFSEIAAVNDNYSYAGEIRSNEH
jgi:hypothetical protein